MSIMEDIKKLLLEGKSIKEIKELGFKAPSIYKVKKQLKDESGTPPVELPVEPLAEPPEKKFPKNNKPPEEVLDTGNTELDNTSPSNLNLGNIPKENKEENPPEGITPETFEDDVSPFREFNEVGIDRTYIDIGSSPGSDKQSSISKDQTTGTGQLGVTELLTQIYSIVGIVTGHEHWELSSKEQKIVKHLCKIPALEKFLHKFGLYGCVISLITITFKKIKEEIHLKDTLEMGKRPYHGENKEEIVRPDSPSSIMESIGVEP